MISYHNRLSFRCLSFFEINNFVKKECQDYLQYSPIKENYQYKSIIQLDSVAQKYTMLHKMAEVIFSLGFVSLCKLKTVLVISTFIHFTLLLVSGKKNIAFFMWADIFYKSKM